MKHDEARPPKVKSFADLTLLAHISGGLDKLIGKKFEFTIRLKK